MKISCFFVVWGRENFSGLFKFMRILTVLLFALSYIACSQKTDIVSSEIYRSEKGYAYRIFIRGKLALQQETIPGVPGAKPFCDRRDAAKTCQLVKQKIQRRQNPAVSQKEIDSLTIKTKC